MSCRCDSVPMVPPRAIIWMWRAFKPRWSSCLAPLSDDCVRLSAISIELAYDPFSGSFIMCIVKSEGEKEVSVPIDCLLSFYFLSWCFLFRPIFKSPHQPMLHMKFRTAFSNCCAINSKWNCFYMADYSSKTNTNRSILDFRNWSFRIHNTSTCNHFILGCML